MESTHTVCKACDAPLTGKYCSECGEKVYSDHDKSMLHFVEEGFHFVTHFEGTFFRTLRYIFTAPGKLAERYCFGVRKSLFKPISLYFLLVVIYLIFPVFEGLNMRLNFYAGNWAYGKFASHQISAAMQGHAWTFERLSEVFHEKAAHVSKFLLLILLPLTALLLWPLTFRKRPLFFDQMVFSAEVNSFYLIWGFLVLPLILMLVELVAVWITGHYLPVNDGLIGPLVYLVLAVYVSMASRRFYKLHPAASVGLGLYFFLAHYLIVNFIYKLLLFMITMWLLGGHA